MSVMSNTCSSAIFALMSVCCVGDLAFLQQFFAFLSATIRSYFIKFNKIG